MAGFQNLRVNRTVDFTGATKINVGGGINDLLGGKTYFVDCRRGSNSYEGTSSAYPLATLEAAYAKCTTKKNDYIFVQNFWTLTTAPLTIAKNDVHIISLGSGNFDNGNDIDGGSSVALSIANDGVDFEIAGFNLGNDGTTYALEVPAGNVAYRVHIHHCTFGHNYAATDGIHASELSHSTIDNCLFSDMLTGYGLWAFVTVDSMISNCIFRGIEEKGIYTGARQAQIWGNMFFSPIADTEASGWGITLTSASSGCFVANNFASDTGDAAGAKPYRDESTATAATVKNGWAGNWFGNACIDPNSTGD